ncbi:MAG TPA: HD-GYP domain-containing protein [Novimethylophilus sp.]|uniref:HD-GYP domain-containing protein n=1 Tax=Novimethylophilus sp. TaxID=2137426 RepID=UPI002F401129
MIKKVPVGLLKPGMYIQDLSSDWMAHPFLRNQFMLKTEGEIRQIGAAGIHEVYINTAKGLDVSDAPTAAEVKQEVVQEMLRIASEENTPVRTVGTSEEMRKARMVHSEANQIIRNIMQDVRLGNQVQIEKVEPVVENITSSILRNAGAILSLCRVKNKDNYTFFHSVSVCALQVSFCRSIGMDKESIRQAGVGGLLHDIGKVKIPDEILNKPGRFTEDEFRVMQCHVVESRRILTETEGISEIAIQVAAQHHERHDGSGYPEGLKGDEISQMGQMAAICDVYDAITSNRCYHKGMEPTEALQKIFEWSKFHFNPVLVQHFMRSIGIYPVGSLVRLESGKLGVVTEQAEHNLLQPKVRVIYDSKKQSYLPPSDLDLAKPMGHGGADRIVNHELPEKWNIEPLKFI